MKIHQKQGQNQKRGGLGLLRNCPCNFIKIKLLFDLLNNICRNVTRKKSKSETLIPMTTGTEEEGFS